MEQREFTVLAPAKINFRLKVTGRRADGYHLLDMLNGSVALSDRMVVTIGEGDTVECLIRRNPELASRLRPADNLVVKAVHIFSTRFNWKRSVRVVLEKFIPTGAGLAGGSSDAAAMLRVLVQAATESGLAIPESSIAALALELGADVPYCLTQSFAHVQGIGESLRILVPSPVSGIPCLLVIPPVHSETPKVFQEFARKASSFSRSETFERLSYQSLLALVDNDLTEAACHLHPELSFLRDFLGGVDDVVASMSGSGSCFFCLSSDPTKANEVLEKLSARPELSGYELVLTHFI